MPRKNTRNTKGRIISAAWKLFYEQGYEDTTVEDIVFESETSKGSFYHYFDGKDALLGTLAYVFDEKYEELKETMSPDLDAMEKLVYLNHELFAMIDGGVSMDLLARLLSNFWPGVKSICWTGTAPISSCCGRSSPMARRPDSFARTAPSTRS